MQRSKQAAVALPKIGSERESVNPGDFIDFLRVGIFRYTRRDAKY